MKILMICNKSPFPKVDGGAIGLYNNITALSKAGYKLKVLAANTNKNFIDINTVPKSFMDITDLELIPINLKLNPFSAFINLIKGKSYNITRFYNKNFEQIIINHLKNTKYDIIQLEYLPMAVYIDCIRKHTKAPIVLRNHNVEYKIWERISENTFPKIKKWYINQLVKTLKKFEIQSINNVDGVISTTTVDAKVFKEISPKQNVLAIPTSFNSEQLPVDYTQNGNSNIFHIGAMNWFPNEEGIKWFIEKIFPKVKETVPEIKFHIAGRHIPQWINNLLINDIIIDGEVDDAFEYMKKFDIMVVPLLSGSGIRVKIIEGMANGRAIVTTSIGAEGINITNGKNIIIADNANDFAAAIIDLYNNPTKRKDLGLNARKFIEEEHLSEKLIIKLNDFYNNLLIKND